MKELYLQLSLAVGMSESFSIILENYYIYFLQAMAYIMALLFYQIWLEASDSIAS